MNIFVKLVVVEFNAETSQWLQTFEFWCVSFVRSWFSYGAACWVSLKILIFKVLKLLM